MKSVYTITLSLMLAAVANAATISVGAGVGASQGLIAQTSTNTLLSTGGYYIAAGSFATVPTVVSGDQASLLSAVNSFNIFASLTSPTTGTPTGTISGSFTAVPATASDFNNKQIYFLIGNAASKALSTEFAIITTAGGTLFPADTTAGGATTVTFSSAASFSVLTNAGTKVDNPSGRDYVKLLSAVPEPSAALLGMLGALGLLRRRR